MITPLFKIYQEAKKTRSMRERSDILKKYDMPQLREFIAYVINPNITFLLPPGNPPYKESDGINMEDALYNRMQMFPYFIAHCGKPIHKLSRVKREQLFTELLENIHPEDAKIVLRLKESKMEGYPRSQRWIFEHGLTGITKNIATDAFPGHYTFLSG